MSFATGAGGDPPLTLGSTSYKPTRGPTTGSTSEKVVRWVEGAKVVGYDPIQQTFYQTIREKHRKIGVFSMCLGVYICGSIPMHISSSQGVLPQSIDAIWPESIVSSLLCTEILRLARYAQQIVIDQRSTLLSFAMQSEFFIT